MLIETLHAGLAGLYIFFQFDNVSLKDALLRDPTTPENFYDGPAFPVDSQQQPLGNDRLNGTGQL